MKWNRVHFPIQPDDPLPPERKVVLVWCDEQPEKSRGGSALPYCGYIRYAAGDLNCPFFVVYHGNDQRSTAVIAWCDCLPDRGPDWAKNTGIYNEGQPEGRGFPARPVPDEAMDETQDENDLEKESVVRALRESQRERDKLTWENASLKAENEQLKDWYPLEDEATRVFVSTNDGGDGDCGWSAVFRDSDDAEKWRRMIKDDPEDGRNEDILDGEIHGLRFWNNALDPMPSERKREDDEPDTGPRD